MKPTPKNEPEYPHKVRFDRLKRKGQRCKILRNSGIMCQIEFEDGFTAVLSRRDLVRAE